MYTEDQRRDERPEDVARALVSSKAQGEDRQLPGIGYRRDRPISVEASKRSPESSGPSTSLLTGVGIALPAALLVPALRGRLSRGSRLDRADQFAAHVAPEFRVQRRRQTGGSLLLAMGLAGGVLLYWLRRSGQSSESIRQAARAVATRAKAFATGATATLQGALTPPLSSPGAPAGNGQSGEGRDTTEPSVPIPAPGRWPDSATPSTDAEGQGLTERRAGAERAEAIRAERSEIPAQEQPAPAAASAPATPPVTAPAPQIDSPAPAPPSQAELLARIVAHMTVVDNKGARVGAVDRIEGQEKIKLTKDGQGRHHHVPLDWVARVDTRVHLDRSLKEVRQAFKARQPRGR